MRVLAATLLTLLLALSVPWPALAQEPITTTVTGVLEDQDPVTGNPVTRTITLTLTIPGRPFTATTLSSGSWYVLEQSATFGDVFAGSGSCVMVIVFLFWVTLRLARRKV